MIRIRALIRIKESGSSSLFRQSLRARFRTVTASGVPIDLIRIWEDAQEPLARFLQDPDIRVRTVAQEIAEQLGSRSC